MKTNQNIIKSKHGFDFHWLKVTAIGFIAGGLGQLSIYPLDTVKTRLQNQNFNEGILYRNSFDCLKKIVKTEGIFSLYRGVINVAILTRPEKALKLFANDFMREKLAFENGKLNLGREMLAGATAGFCQVIITCPMELIKIQIQVKETKKKSIYRLIQDLGGIKNIYRGMTSTWLRDIPFSFIYFPVYHGIKGHYSSLLKPNENLTLYHLFVASLTAGSLAAGAVTPLDVVKTRMQAQTNNDRKYSGNLDCIMKTFKNEGFKAFWKGLGMRLLSRGPQFTVTMLSYEWIQKTILGNVQSDHTNISSNKK